jgi:hypothetical protein
MYSPHTSVPSPGTTPPKPTTFIFKVRRLSGCRLTEGVNIPRLPPLVPQRHRTCLGRLRIDLCDTMAPSAVMWKASYERLGTVRLGTVITSIYFVVGPSQGSLERSL